MRVTVSEIPEDFQILGPVLYHKNPMTEVLPQQVKLIQSRPGTQDEVVFREVMVENEYRLPEKFETTDLIFDIGAHIGIFSVACLERGAGTVLAIEPDEDNYRLLEKNLEPYRDRAFCLRAAVWRPGRDYVEFSGYPEGMSACGSVMPFVTVGGQNHRVQTPAYSLNNAFGLIGESRVRLMKVDAEGAEYTILYSTKLEYLRRVDEIVMEVHEWGELPQEARIPGFTKYNAEGLKEHFELLGFNVELELLRDYPKRNARAFHLFASQ